MSAGGIMEPDVVRKVAGAKKAMTHTHPEPEVTARPVVDEVIPRSVASMAKLAEGAGWSVEITYARGTTYSTQPRLVHSLAVRMRRDGRRAVAVWTCPADGEKWTFQFGGRLGGWQCQKTGLSGTMPVKLSSAELKHYLVRVETVTPEDVWGAGFTSEEIEGLEALASLFVGDEVEAS